jgi:hypothetical protein
MSTATTTHVTETPTVPLTLQWRSWPLRQRLPWSLLLPAGLLLMGWAVARFTGSPTPGLVALLLLTASLWRFWLPVNFEFTPRGIVQRCLGRTRFTAWSKISGVQVGHQGLRLLRSGELTSAERLSGMYLPWGNQREEVLKFIELIGKPINQGKQ